MDEHSFNNNPPELDDHGHALEGHAHHDAEAVMRDVPRRKLLAWLVGIINVGVLGAVIAHTLGFIASPLGVKKPKGKWVDILPDGSLADGEVRAVTYELDVPDGYMTSRRKYSVWVGRKGDRLSAFDPSCPHLGCHVDFKSRKRRFVCPCHGGVFDDDGGRVSGPPPRGLTKIAVKSESGRIWIYKV